MIGRIFVAIFCLAAVPTLAQQQSVRLRGTIEQVDGPTFTVKLRGGETLKVRMADDVKVIAMVKASLADIKSGSFVGSTALPDANGRWRAVEVHIFPEAMRGVGEGDRPNDYRPKSTMTNGTVGNIDGSSGAAAVARQEGATLTLSYKEGEKKIDVPSDAVVYTYVPGSRDELKPGAIISTAAAKQADGSLLAARINVARGITPPM